MNQQTGQGVVLARTDYGEADRIVTFLTPGNGKVRVVAKGVRKPKSKLAGGIELFSVSSITYIKGRRDLDTLISSRLEKHFANIVKDIERTMFGYEILKVLNKLVEDEGGEGYYDLLVESMTALDNLQWPKELAESWFYLQLMRLLGHLPEFTKDNSGVNLPQGQNFEFNFDEMVFHPKKDGHFSQNHLKLLKLLSYNSPRDLVKVQGLDEYLQQLTPLVKQMARQYLIQF